MLRHCHCFAGQPACPLTTPALPAGTREVWPCLQLREWEWVLTRDNQREKSWVLSRWDAVLHRLAPEGEKVGGELRTKILDSDYIRVNWGCVRSQNLNGP